jgi:tRNA(fMet)-specific endonuclease VapC
MAGGRVAVDTNVVIALLQGEPQVVNNFERCEEVLLPFPVKGELAFGALKSGNPEKNAERLDRVFAKCVTIPSSREVEGRYARIKLGLSAMGRPIPENDIWVAACAVAEGVPLATRDRHFDSIEGLEVLFW